MFRSEADLNMGFNCLAVAVLETESRLMGEGLMTTHYHCLLQTDRYREMMHRTRYAYARYFNTKYCRRGRLGKKEYFMLEIKGLHHTVAALNYVLRQGIHHGLAKTPFDYPHGSANSIFRNELGKSQCPSLMPAKNRHRYLPANVRVPEKYRMSDKGILLREDIVDTAYVEEIYISPRNFLFQMNKIAGEEENSQQRIENDSPPITLELIENGVSDFSIQKAKVFEQGRVDYGRMTDLELCAIIDNNLLPRYFNGLQERSVYLLPESKRAEMGQMLWNEFRQSRWHMAGRSDGSRQKNTSKGFLSGRAITEQQLRRCLALP